MNERERADALARAIDELLRGAQTPEPDFDDEDLRSLLRIAGARLQQSSQAVLKAADHETEVWRRLVARLHTTDEPADNEPEALIPDEDDVRDVIAARRRVSEDVLAIAEQHREDVWRRVQERIANKLPKRKGIFSFLQSRTDGDLPARTATSRNRVIPTGDSELDSLLRVALGPTSLREAGEREISDSQVQLQARMRSDPTRQRTHVEPPAPRTNLWLRAGALAVIAAIAASLGPLPITGLSNSPVAEAARFVGQHIGVTETNDVPPTPINAISVARQEMTAAEASSQLGLTVSAPAELLGFPLASQSFYKLGITSTGAGTFVAIYQSAGASLTVYEEAAGGSDFAVPPGSATDVTVGGTTATYYEGGWSFDNGALTWQATGIQTLVFDRNGVRFTIQYTGSHIEPPEFAAAAAALG